MVRNDKLGFEHPRKRFHSFLPKLMAGLLKIPSGKSIAIWYASG